MTDQQRYRLKEMAAQQSDLVDKLKALRKENERLKWLLGNANERVAELTDSAEHVIATAWGNTDGLTAEQQLAALRGAAELLLESLGREKPTDDRR